MNTDKIKIFLDLAESLNFSRTAQNMNITQSAVSQSISSLERYLNTKLFYRSRKQVTLTPAGQLFYQGMHPVITQFNKAVTHAREVAQSVNTLLTIGFAGSGYDRYAINQLVQEYSKYKPDVKIFLENYDHRTMVSRLKQGFCDVVLTRPESIDSGITLSYQKLLDGRFYAVCSKHYGYAGSRPV
ncbi:LysR family transcriptional regulator, partial [Lactobacillus nasalidis]